MVAFGNIVVFHPAAIGDVMLATPVAATLKLNFPGARLTYWTHPELHELLIGLCPSVDEAVDYARETHLFRQIETFEKLKPDLFVDLANSTTSKAVTWLTRGVKVLRYKKKLVAERPIQHATGNFLDTIKPVCMEFPERLFPTIFPDAIIPDLLNRLFESYDLETFSLIGLVPGVGGRRPHRAWIKDGWLYLIRYLQSHKKYLPVLIGGSDDVQLCTELTLESGGECLNVAGKLSLAETAAMLKSCRVVISGDTGPAHLAVAVGTRVIGLYGPTFPLRSGPYGCSNLVIDQSRSCRCIGLKHCRYANINEAAECMARISLEEIVAMFQTVIKEESVDV